MNTAVVILSHFYGIHGFSDRQLRRMKKGMEVFKEKKADYVIGTGGFGFFNRSKIALGQRTKDYLESQGLDGKMVLFEGVSKNTEENFEAILPIVGQYSIRKLIVVTSVDHILRAKYIGKKIVPKEVEMEFVISDYHSTLKVTVWDFFWHLGGWAKLGWREIKNYFSPMADKT